MPVVSRTGETLGGNGTALGTRARLQEMEQREAHRLLDRGIALHLDVRARPEVVQLCALLGEQPSQPVDRAAESAATIWSRIAGCDRTADHRRR